MVFVKMSSWEDLSVSQSSDQGSSYEITRSLFSSTRNIFSFRYNTRYATVNECWQDNNTDLVLEEYNDGKEDKKSGDDGDRDDMRKE